MNDFSKIKASLLKQLDAVDPKDKDATEKIVNTLKAISDAEKSSLDAAKTDLEIKHYEQDQKRDLNKFFIGVIAPLVSAFALVITLGFQFYQTNQNTRLQIEASEATEWRGLLGKLDSIKNSDLTIPTSLKSFFDSKKYGKPSRELASLMLPQVSSEKVFQVIFPEFMDRTNWSNFKDAKNLLEGLNEMYDEDHSVLQRDSSNLKTFLENYKMGFIQKYINMNQRPPDSISIPTPNIPSIYTSRLDADNHYSAERTKEIVDVGQAIANFLKKNRRDPSTQPLDLSGCFFFKTDFTGIDLTKANVKNAYFSNCILQDCIMDSLDYDNATWFQTAWWRAKSMDSATFKGFNQAAPFDSSNYYYTINTNENDSLEYANFTKRFKLK